jgi:ribonuclease P protein component
MIPYRNTFSKEERLCSRTIIQDLFSRREAHTALIFPLAATWRFQLLPSASPAQVLFSIPKKKFKKAHDRNRLRRQLRESYRLQKNLLYEPLNSQRLQCAVVITYIAQDKLPYTQIENACRSLLEKIIESIR